VSRDPDQLYLPGAVLDEEQHMQAAQEDRVDMEEVCRQDGLRVGIQERPARSAGTAGVPGRCLRP
jgi:hypothetical protein